MASKEKTELRLDKYLADMGVETRSKVGKLIRKGAVTVNGEMVRNAAAKVNTKTDVVKVAGQTVTHTTYFYYMLNKPQGVITSTEKGPTPTVMDVLVEAGIDCPAFAELAPVGRLDKDTEGLLLITNDGGLNHRLLSPNSHVDKLYYAEVDGEVTEGDIKAFEKGMNLGDFTSKPAKLVVKESAPGRAKTLVTISEGKFHQIKRMFEKCGKEVTFLKRLKMGTLELDPTLEPGEFRELTKEEIENVVL